MSWNFFDAWKSKRTSEKPLKCSKDEFERQVLKCSKKHKEWQECVETCGFNDSKCREELLKKYYSCFNKQNRMKIYLDEKDYSN
jgi:hypothetical protein